MKKILFNEKVLAHTTTSIAKYLKPKTLGIHHTKRVNSQMHDIWYHYMSGHCTSISIHTKKFYNPWAKQIGLQHPRDKYVPNHYQSH